MSDLVGGKKTLTAIEEDLIYDGIDTYRVWIHHGKMHPQMINLVLGGVRLHVWKEIIIKLVFKVKTIRQII